MAVGGFTRVDLCPLSGMVHFGCADGCRPRGTVKAFSLRELFGI